MSRLLITLFSLNNPAYADATVFAYQADVNGFKTTTLGTLHDSFTGGATVANPFVLDGYGKNPAPIYHDINLIFEIHGVGITEHDTGVLAPTQITGSEVDDLEALVLTLQTLLAKKIGIAITDPYVPPDLALAAARLNSLVGFDGAGDLILHFLNNLAITGGTIAGLSSPIAVADGGTGGATAGVALTNLGAAALSHAHSLADITDDGSMAAQDASAVAITGGTITGIALLGVSNPNLVINGGLNLWEHKTQYISPATGTRVATRWAWAHVGTGVVTVSRDTEIPADTGGYSVKVDVTALDAAIAASAFYFLRHSVEGYDFSQALFGSSAAKTIALSFEIRAPKTGVYCVAFRNSAANRSYIAEITVSAANTWESHTVIVAGDTDVGATWEIGTNAGISVTFALAVGSTFQTTAGSWTAGNFFGSSNQVNAMDNNSNNFYLKNVKLEIASAATPFVDDRIGRVADDSHRYSYSPTTGHGSAAIGVGQATSTTKAIVTIQLPTRMRVFPDNLVLSSAGHFSVYQDDGTVEAVTAMALHGDTTHGVAVLDITVNANLLDGDAVYLRTNTSAGAINIEAEY